MRQKKFRLPRLSRRARLARNLCAALLLVLGSWVLAGGPAWTEAGGPRPLERTPPPGPGAGRGREEWGGPGDPPPGPGPGEEYGHTAAL